MNVLNPVRVGPCMRAILYILTLHFICPPTILTAFSSKSIIPSNRFMFDNSPKMQVTGIWGDSLIVIFKIHTSDHPIQYIGNKTHKMASTPPGRRGGAPVHTFVQNACPYTAVGLSLTIFVMLAWDTSLNGIRGDVSGRSGIHALFGSGMCTQTT